MNPLEGQLALGDFGVPAPPPVVDEVFVEVSEPVGRLSLARAAFHRQLLVGQTLCVTDAGVASNADKDQHTSRVIAGAVAQELGASVVARKLDGQRAGKQFEEAVTRFLADSMPLLEPVRPGPWRAINVGGARAGYHVANYEPFAHLAQLRDEVVANPTLTSVLGNSYEISPDVLVLREPVSDAVLNRCGVVVDGVHGVRSVTRAANSAREIVHAVVSCKWTLRSDRAQNARSEALNIIRNRKGRTPHIVVVTGEPTPSRLASLALGTGDIDMVYHFALPELVRAVDECGNDEAVHMLGTLVQGQRLRDVSDLPLDLAV